MTCFGMFCLFRNSGFILLIIFITKLTHTLSKIPNATGGIFSIYLRNDCLKFFETWHLS